MNDSSAISPARMATLGVGWFGIQVFWAFHGGPLPLFLKGFTDSKFEISLVLSLAGLAGCIVPPLAGVLSDRTVTRFGRRRPYVFAGFVGVLLSLFWLPHAGGLGAVAALAACMYFSLRLAETPFLSLLPDVTPPEQRSTASGVMNLLGSVGLIACFTLASLIWDEHPTAMFHSVALVSFATVLVAISLIREPPVSRTGQPEAVQPLRYLRSIAAEKNALTFFVAQFFWWLGFWMVSTFFTLFTVEELGVVEGKSFLVLMTFSLVATVFMLPLGMLGDRLGRKGILTGMVVAWAALDLAVGLSQTFGQALFTVGASAIPFAGVMGVGYAYMLDLVPRSRTAEFVGFSVISIAVAQVVGPILGGRLIDAVGYRSIFPAGAALMLTGAVVLHWVRPRPA